MRGGTCAKVEARHFWRPPNAKPLVEDHTCLFSVGELQFQFASVNCAPIQEFGFEAEPLEKPNQDFFAILVMLPVVFWSVTCSP